MSIVIKDGIFTPPSTTPTPLLFELNREMSPSEITDMVTTSDGFVVPFPTFGDGWGFSIAKALRDYGYTGYLRARGYLISDQYPLAIRSGFDDIEIPDDLATRGGESSWKSAYDRSVIENYRDKLRSD